MAWHTNASPYIHSPIHILFGHFVIKYTFTLHQQPPSKIRLNTLKVNVDWKKNIISENTKEECIPINDSYIFKLLLQQPDLPKLPVPELEKTLQRYLEAVQPILQPQQFERAQELAKQLAENEGPELQHHLVERQMKLKNWVNFPTQRCCIMYSKQTFFRVCVLYTCYVNTHFISSPLSFVHFHFCCFSLNIN